MLHVEARTVDGQQHDTKRLWELARSLWAWDVVVASPTDLATAIEGAGSALVRLRPKEDPHRAIRDTVAAVGELEPWAIVARTDRLSVREFADLARDLDLYLLDVRAGNLVAVRSSNPHVLSTLLSAAWLDTYEALIVNAPEVVGLA